MRRRVLPIVVLAVVAMSGCDDRAGVRSAEASTSDSASIARRIEAGRARQDSIVRARPGYIIDRILPVTEEIRRFQATIPERPAGFSHGAKSRTALIGRLVAAIERNDARALGQLVVSRAEFGFLIYPTSPNAAPPYRQSPELVWLSRAAATDKGMTRLLARFGGSPLRYVGYACADTVDRQGDNTLWSGCVVKRVVSPGDTARIRLFGSIVERGGQFKFLSLSNGL